MTRAFSGRQIFWTLHIGGWGAFAIAMTLSRIGRFPLGYMAWSKGLLALTGAILSLGLAWVYRRTLADDASLPRTIAVVVVASYLMALPWTALDNWLDIPVRRAILRDEVRFADVAPLLGSLYNAFILLSWSLLYVSVKSFLALAAARERTALAEAQANAAQLQALRFQIQPHLLFNSLNALSTLIVEHRTDEAARMVSRISDFLRHTLATPPEQTTTLQQELGFVEKYLDIERVRFGDRLRVETAMAPDTLACRVPAFVLQPLVENAVRYAVEPVVDGGRIVIASRRDGPTLVLEVRDASDGARTREGRDGFGGIGLSNTRTRLEQLYGARQALSLQRREDGEHIVTIRIPASDARGDA